MCGIAGFSSFNQNFTNRQNIDWNTIAEKMGKSLSNRGPDGNGIFAVQNAVFAHTRLAVRDIERGAQPMTRAFNGFNYTLCYNGEIYNANELRKDLTAQGYEFTTTSDTEVLLYTYIHYGPGCTEKLNGIFAFAIWDEKENCCYLCRDRFGIKPLFYAMVNNTLVFGSEIKALLEFPGISRKVGKLGFAELFSIGPARTPGFGIFKDISEILPGEFAIFNEYGFRKYPYWRLNSFKHTDNFDESVATVKHLTRDAISRQLVSDVPICTFLSGGLDSSVITAVAAKHAQERGERLDTFSFDYADNDKYFSSSDYQPETDRPWVEKVSRLLNTRHHFLECDIKTLFDNLYEAVKLKDLPGMADVDSSLIYFGKEVAKDFKVALSGE